jgi:hypothetical protein
MYHFFIAFLGWFQTGSPCPIPLRPLTLKCPTLSSLACESTGLLQATVTPKSQMTVCNIKEVYILAGIANSFNRPCSPLPCLSHSGWAQRDKKRASQLLVPCKHPTIMGTQPASWPGLTLDCPGPILTSLGDGGCDGELPCGRRKTRWQPVCVGKISGSYSTLYCIDF